MTGLRYSPLHVTELCGEMRGKFIVGRARLIIQQARKSLYLTDSFITLRFLCQELAYWNLLHGQNINLN